MTTRVCFIVLLALGLAACRREVAPTGGEIVLVGDAADTIRLAQPAARIVSLLPTATEVLFAIGAGSALAGRTTWCDYPAEATQVPSLGDALFSPNLEAIAGLKPDLVLLYAGGSNATTAGRLRDLGIPALLVRTDQLSDVTKVARLLGTATGHEREADSLSRALDAALARVTVRDSAGPSVFILVWDQPLTTIGRGSFLSDLVERAGGRNTFADIAAPSAPVSIEAVAKRDPRHVLRVTSAPGPLSMRPEWVPIRALAEQRILRFSGSEFMRPTPRAANAILGLRSALGT